MYMSYIYAKEEEHIEQTKEAKKQGHWRTYMHAINRVIGNHRRSNGGEMKEADGCKTCIYMYLPIGKTICICI